MTNDADNRMQKILASIPPRDSRDDYLMFLLMLDESVGMLTHLLDAIGKWESIAWEEFASYKQLLKAKYPGGFPEHYDPLTDEAFIRHHTGLALYGSLAVAICAKVEDDLGCLLGVSKIEIGSKKPQFNDYVKALEKSCKCEKSAIPHFQEHLLVRELANRFKHSGGKATAEFVQMYGLAVNVAREDEDIPYDGLPWSDYISHAKELLLDVAKRLSEREGEMIEEAR